MSRPATTSRRSTSSSPRSRGVGAFEIRHSVPVAVDMYDERGIVSGNVVHARCGGSSGCD